MEQTFSQLANIVRKTFQSNYPQVKRAYIFGSYASGMQSSNSDLDVVIELDSSIGLLFMSMIQEIEKEAGMPVDILTVNQVEKLENKFGYDIMRKAQVVYERSAN